MVTVSKSLLLDSVAVSLLLHPPITRAAMTNPLSATVRRSERTRAYRMGNLPLSMRRGVRLRRIAADGRFQARQEA